MVDRFKINFELEQDEDGYPPYQWEGLWAEKICEGKYRIDNIPFYAKKISIGDIISVRSTNEGIVFESIQQKSENSTIRVITFNESVQPHLLELIKKCGCEYEIGKPKTLVAINVPPDANFSLLLEFLKREHKVDNLDYEESSIRYNSGGIPGART